MTRKDENGNVIKLNHAFIYGPNGSGKSNFVKAFQFAQKAILSGTIADGINRSCFTKSTEPTYIEFVLEIKGNMYSYGFEYDYNNPYYQSEWLHQLKPEGNEKIFEWSYKGTNPGSSLSERDITCIPDGFSFNTENIVGTDLFLKHNHNVDSRVEDVYSWFKNSLIVKDADSGFDCTPVPPNFPAILKQYLEYFDTGIIDVELTPISGGGRLLLRDFTSDNKLLSGRLDLSLYSNNLVYIQQKGGFSSGAGIFLYVEQKRDSLNVSELRFRHSLKNDKYTGAESESTGTIRIIQLIAFLLSEGGSSTGSTLVIDEIECSIHPIVMEAYIKLFNLPDFKEVQLILTTHEQVLMKVGYANVDDIWFIDSKDDCSKLYSLRSFGHDMKNYDKMYLEGRFSATPKFSNYDLESDQDD